MLKIHSNLSLCFQFSVNVFLPSFYLEAALSYKIHPLTSHISHAMLSYHHDKSTTFLNSCFLDFLIPFWNILSDCCSQLLFWASLMCNWFFLHTIKNSKRFINNMNFQHSLKCHKSIIQLDFFTSLLCIQSVFCCKNPSNNTKKIIPRYFHYYL